MKQIKLTMHMDSFLEGMDGETLDRGLGLAEQMIGNTAEKLDATPERHQDWFLAHMVYSLYEGEVARRKQVS